MKSTLKKDLEWVSYNQIRTAEQSHTRVARRSASHIEGLRLQESLNGSPEAPSPV